METSRATVPVVRFVSEPEVEAKRRRRSVQERRRIVEETLAPGASVARVARAHGVNANQVLLAHALSPWKTRRSLDREPTSPCEDRGRCSRQARHRIGFVVADRV